MDKNSILDGCGAHALGSSQGDDVSSRLQNACQTQSINSTIGGTTRVKDGTDLESKGVLPSIKLDDNSKGPPAPRDFVGPPAPAPAPSDFVGPPAPRDVVGPPAPTDAVAPTIPLERDIARLSRMLETLFFKIDKDRDGYITMAELNATMRDPSLSPEQASLVAMLKKYFEKITPLNDDGLFTGSSISRQDLTQFISAWRDNLNSNGREGRNRELINGAMVNLVENQQLLNRSGMSLYADANNPLASIVPAACSQPFGVSNDHFVGAMASLAASNPQAIRDMIHDNGNGSYNVTFPGREAITVQAPTAAELAYYGVDSPHGTWAAVLQMAYGQLWSPTGQMPLEGAGSSNFDDGLRTLSGLGADTDYNRFTRYDTLNTWLNNSLNGTPRRPVTAQLNHWFMNLGGSAAPGLMNGHAYGVIGFSPNATDITQGVITLRNPLGYNRWPDNVPPQGVRALSNGDFSMTLETFNRLFSAVTYAR